MDGQSAVAKPVLRGWSHALAVIPAIGGTLLLVEAAGGNPTLSLSLVVYGGALTLLFAVSATYHLLPWSLGWKARWRRMDHAMIFVAIAGTYTPIIGNVLDAWPRAVMLAAIWGLAIAGVTLSISPVQLPRSLLAASYVLTGWLALAALPLLAARLGAAGLVYPLLGGVLYSVGAVVYASRRPKLWPHVFGYHELFHLLVIAGAAVFFAFIAIDVVAVKHG